MFLSLVLLLAFSVCANAQLLPEVVVQFQQGEYQMTPKQSKKMTNEIQAIYTAYPNAVIVEIEANAWEHARIGGFLTPVSILRGQNVLQELNRWEATIPMLPTDQSVVNPIQRIHSGTQNQQVVIRFGQFL